MKEILIIGAGKVGTATGISLGNMTDFHDPYKGIINNSFNNYKYIIICVDTVQTGPDDYNDLESVLSELSDYGYSGVVAIRSTVSPTKIDEWDYKYKLNYIMFPEFMPQRDGALVVDSAWIAVLGGDIETSRSFANEVLIKHRYPAPVDSYRYVSRKEASIIKLADNAGLAAKLIYFNAIYRICESFESSYENVRDAIGLDARINKSHSIVPSPDDGLFGFGGHCLPKDLLAISAIDDLGFFDVVDSINKKLR
jgi:UDP-glucose 6-dehydrogenase